jgi:hypothetical protein
MALDRHREHLIQDKNPEETLNSAAHGSDAICFAALLNFKHPEFIDLREKVLPPAQAFAARQFLILDSHISLAVTDVANHFGPPDNNRSSA